LFLFFGKREHTERMVLTNLPYPMEVTEEFPSLETGTCFSFIDLESDEQQQAIVVDSSLALVWIFGKNKDPKVGEEIEGIHLIDPEKPLNRTNQMNPIPNFDDFVSTLSSRVKSHFRHRGKHFRATVDAEEAEVQPIARRRRRKESHPSTMPESSAEVKLQKMIAFLKELRELMNKYGL